MTTEEPSDEAVGVARFFVDLWAHDVRRLAAEVSELQEKYSRDLRAADYGEEWSPTEEDLHDLFGRRWLAEHRLVWSAHQLEAWTIRLAREQHQPEPTPDPTLKQLRNALEHLSEANLSEDRFTPAEGDKGNGLRKLPGRSLAFGTAGPLMFGLVDAAELRRRALDVVTTADRLMEEAEAWVQEFGMPFDPADDPEEGGDGPAPPRTGRWA